MEFNEAEAYEVARSMDRAIYYVYLLKKGPTWSPDSSPEIDVLQEAHLNNLRRLGEEGKLVLNGPLLDSFQLSGEIRRIGVLKAKSLTEAQEWISTDPKVKVERLVFELHAWMVAKGPCLDRDDSAGNGPLTRRFRLTTRWVSALLRGSL
jgi:uncharacterized protein YciI